MYLRGVSCHMYVKHACILDYFNNNPQPRTTRQRLFHPQIFCRGKALMLEAWCG